jgi:hypothetical protein
MNTHRKGSRWRRTVQSWLDDLGCVTSFRPWMQAGDDVRATLGDLALSIEAKDHRSLDLAGWIKQAEANSPADHVPVVIAKRRGKTSPADAYFILSGASFARLIGSRIGRSDSEVGLW